MFYSVASPDWKPGQPLAPVGALLFRTRCEAVSFTPDAVVVSVLVRYDATAQVVASRRRGCRDGETWSARAVPNRFGGITVFDIIPADLIGLASGDRTLLGEAAKSPAEPAANAFHGWDSLTMALLA